MKTKMLFSIFFVLLAASVWAQFNTVNLDFTGTYNSLSIDSAAGIVVTGRADHVAYVRYEKQLQLTGTRAFIQKNPDVILTYGTTGDTTSILCIYTFDGQLQATVPFNGIISALAALPGQSVVYLTVNAKIDIVSTESAVYAFDLITRHTSRIFLSGASELTSISMLQGNRLGLSGTQLNYIISTDGNVIKEISAPNRSFSKANRQQNLFIILQEFSDGCFVDIYDTNGQLLRAVKYTHRKKAFQGTRRCRECKTKLASFEDVDLSPDQHYFIARDQYNQVFVLDENNKLYTVFADSQEWCFLTFISNTEFMYLDKKTNEMKRLKLQ